MSFAVNDCARTAPASSGRLRWRRKLAGNVGLRNRLLLDRPDRLARFAVEDEQESVLRCLGDDIDGAAVLTDRQQLRRLRQVVIPQVVMHELPMPDASAGACVKGHERIAKEVVALRSPP
jgi:hypothetical protein